MFLHVFAHCMYLRYMNTCYKVLTFNSTDFLFLNTVLQTTDLIIHGFELHELFNSQKTCISRPYCTTNHNRALDFRFAGDAKKGAILVSTIKIFRYTIAAIGDFSPYFRYRWVWDIKNKGTFVMSILIVECWYKNNALFCIASKSEVQCSIVICGRQIGKVS